MTERLAAARDALDRADDAWDGPRVDALLARTRATVVRRRRQRSVGMAIAAAVVLTIGVASWTAMREVEPTALEYAGTQALDEASGPSAAGWTMDVGESRVATLHSGTDVRALPDEGGRAGFELVAGAVRVDAVALRVLVADKLLIADAASFELERLEHGFELRVLAGQVHFGDRRLGPTARLVFDRSADAAAGTEPVVAPGEPADEPVRKERPKTASKPKWRALVQSRDYADAYTEMKRADPKTVRASVDALMAAADAARFGDHPDEAPSYLSEVVDDHAKHAMAPLAAFTLGRVYLEQLGASHKAAQAFARARALAPKGALADDALAREVEAWAKAGEREKARERGREYLELHPDGRRAAAVRRHADLPAP